MITPQNYREQLFVSKKKKEKSVTKDVTKIEFKTHSISCIFPKTSDEEIIKNTIKKSIDDIIDVEITDIYTGHQIADDSISMTFKIQSFDKSTVVSVERLLKGFGGIIR